MLPPALGDLRTCVSPFLGQPAPRNVSKSDLRILYYNALAWSMGLGIMQRFRIWRRDVLRRIHRVGNLSPAEAAESAEGGFGQREPPRPMDRVLNPSVLSEVAGQPPRVIQSGIQARIPC